MTTKLNIGEKIRIRRKELNMTQERLAELSDLSPNFISRLERTTDQNVSLRALEAISKALDISVSALLKLGDHVDVSESSYYVQTFITELLELPDDQANRISKHLLGLLQDMKDASTK